MTKEYREYAKSRIEYLLKICRLDERDKEALEAAIKALSQEPQCTEHPCLGTLCRYYKEPCDDAVNRQAVLEMAYDMSEIDGEHFTEPHMVVDVEDIQKLPPVTQKSGKWIPVSEKLPEAFRFVNCTCHSLIDDRKDWVVETCYIPQPPDSPYSDWGNIPMLNMGDCEVVAWMYRDIPKPYKVEPQEGANE